MFIETVKKAKFIDTIDGNHVSIDSTKVDAYEAPQPTKNIIDDSNHSIWRMKRDTHGNNFKWFWWKIHILSDLKSELPMVIKETPASVYDSVVATSLVEFFFTAKVLCKEL